MQLAALAETLLAALNAQRGVVCCRLVETRGSTPQKPGATLLVFADGSQAGTLGGGCVEAEVRRHALAMHQPHGEQTLLLPFQLDHEYGWKDGLICGGRMQVLLEKLQHPTDTYYQQLAARWMGGQSGWVCVALSPRTAENEMPPPAGATWLVDGTGNLLAGRGTNLDCPPLPAALTRPTQDRPKAFVERGLAWIPLQARPRLIILGGGHVGQAVGQLAADVDFDVVAIDDRAEFVSAERFPRAIARWGGPLADSLHRVNPLPTDYALIVTRGHQQDQEALQLVLQHSLAYVGLIGSRRKIRLIFDDLLEQGVKSSRLKQVYAPVGLEIGSQTVAEIAVSMVAELIAHRNLGGNFSGRHPPVDLG